MAHTPPTEQRPEALPRQDAPAARRPRDPRRMPRLPLDVQAREQDLCFVRFRFFIPNSKPKLISKSFVLQVRTARRETRPQNRTRTRHQRVQQQLLGVRTQAHASL